MPVVGSGGRVFALGLWIPEASPVFVKGADLAIGCPVGGWLESRLRILLLPVWGAPTACGHRRAIFTQAETMDES